MADLQQRLFFSNWSSHSLASMGRWPTASSCWGPEFLWQQIFGEIGWGRLSVKDVTMSQVWFWAEMLDGSRWRCHAWSSEKNESAVVVPLKINTLKIFEDVWSRHLLSERFIMVYPTFMSTEDPLQDISLSFRRAQNAQNDPNAPPAKRQKRLGRGPEVNWRCGRAKGSINTKILLVDQHWI